MKVINESDNKKTEMNKKNKSPWKKLLIGILIFIGAIMLVIAAFLCWISVNEYKPADVEKVEITKEATETLTKGDSFRVMAWNMGYGALGDNADFFMDGGTSVMSATEERVDINIAGIAGGVLQQDPDFLLLQEVDLNSKRSYYKNEREELEMRIPGEYDKTFAYNFKAKYVPYPFPENIGQVEGGILTFSKYKVSDASRISLPSPFKWPVRALNLKRCLLVNRIPVQDENGNSSGEELVLVNVHLEAYDDGEGKKEQTEILRSFLQEEYDKGNYVIAGGDFNQTFSNLDVSMYPKYDGMWHCGEIDVSVFDNDWQFLMDNSYPTCRSLDKPFAGADRDSFQYYMIDGFVVSKNVEVSNVETIKAYFAPSDHNPVVIDVKLGD